MRLPRTLLLWTPPAVLGLLMLKTVECGFTEVSNVSPPQPDEVNAASSSLDRGNHDELREDAPPATGYHTNNMTKNHRRSGAGPAAAGLAFGVMQILDPTQLNLGEEMIIVDPNVVSSKLRDTEKYMAQIRTLCARSTPGTCHLYSIRNSFLQQQAEEGNDFSPNNCSSSNSSGGELSTPSSLLPSSSHYGNGKFSSCANFDPLCTLWAARGDCTSDDRADEMAALCAPACTKCIVYMSEDPDKYEDDEEEKEEEVHRMGQNDGVDGPGSRFGEVQIITRSAMLMEVGEENQEELDFDEEEVQAWLAETEEYMTMMNENGIVNCYNYHVKCTVWAVWGECETNPEYMEEECAPACQTCERIQGANENEENEDNNTIEDSEEPEELTPEEQELLEYDVEYLPVYIKMLHNDRLRGGCHELDDLCQQWTQRGECEQGTSLLGSAPLPWRTCKAISTGDRPGTMFGVEQETDYTKLEGDYIGPDKDELFQELEEVAIYMDIVRSSPLYPPNVREACQNFDSMCTLKAMVGMCEEEELYMIPNCAPACGACGQLIFYEI
ncbi:hypothetical protein ACA910_000246 [Epithemia clementina (nom. ined.)]